MDNQLSTWTGRCFSTIDKLFRSIRAILSKNYSARAASRQLPVGTVAAQVVSPQPNQWPTLTSETAPMPKSSAAAAGHTVITKSRKTESKVRNSGVPVIVTNRQLQREEKFRDPSTNHVASHSSGHRFHTL